MFNDLSRLGKYLGQAARLMVGMPDYDNYVEHMQKTHPDKPVMSYILDDLRELGAIAALVAPALRVLHGHEQRFRRVRVPIDPIRAHREALLRMLVPDFAGVDGGIADALMHRGRDTMPEG